MTLQARRTSVIKVKKSETFKEAAFLLEKVRIFDEETWIAYNQEHYQKWRVVASSVLEEARCLYCRFSLYQSIGVYDEFNDDDGTRTLRNVLEEEEISIQSFMGVMNRWMGAYTQQKTVLNTLYIVGNSRSYAEAFCNSLCNIFACVMTCDLHQKDLSALFEVANQTKALYFPPSKPGKIENPYIKTLLSGRQMNVAHGGKIIKVPQIKCIVRLENMPNLDDLPTSKDQHFVIRFQEEVDGPVNFTIHEFRKLMTTYIDNENSSGRAVPSICNNEYSVLCTARAEHECIPCSRIYLF